MHFHTLVNREEVCASGKLSLTSLAWDSLKATRIDFLQEENARLHHTSDYKNNKLIVRRGQAFQLNVTFSRELKANDNVTLEFSFGEDPKPPNGTLLSLDARSGQDDHFWHANILKTDKTECLISVTSPADAMIGKYCLNLEIGPNVYPAGKQVYVLFNPWSKADSVFMTNDDQRAEYVLNDTGYQYSGASLEHILEKPWNFGQFEENILDCCMDLLDRSQLKPILRREPVYISRTMSALVNSDDEHGVLVVSWAGHYPDGTPPLAWTGSVPILQQYYRTQRSVRYGQCWVFSGVLTTIMRCLGIPARSVTTFECARDTGTNINIDRYFNEKGRMMPISDPVWNFHVWNDIWMKRLDLPKGFDGWQAIDGTPLEESQGLLQCGPAPLKAIKKGEVYLPYDTMFVFSEVNADKIYWFVTNVNGKLKYVKKSVDTKAIGKLIITKAVGKNEREDITDQYKFPEGSLEERRAMRNALSYLRKSRSQSGAAAAPLHELRKADLELGVEEVKTMSPGQPIDLNIVLKSKTTSAWTVDLSASCHLESYTGQLGTRLMSLQQTVQTEGKPVIQIPLKVAADVYVNALVSTEDELLVKVTLFAEVQETKENFVKQVTFAFQYPPITVEVPETTKINESFNCEFTFKNTLSIPLENCKLHVEGLGIFPVTTFDQGDIPPGKVFKSEVVCAPRKAGEKKIVAKLNSNQVKGITKEKFISITE
ncbi:protein-glutamine gamma-glutamyltransferase 4-like [Elgaria multicarinata webbii]|uniref:protein-glutamine gamma-glutamyltransferase 4-like n=1 Tax=Elgaria multicarinata webbii TaxID=159646 RepID=UPI002FCD186B